MNFQATRPHRYDHNQTDLPSAFLRAVCLHIMSPRQYQYRANRTYPRDPTRTSRGDPTPHDGIPACEVLHHSFNPHSKPNNNRPRK